MWVDYRGSLRTLVAVTDNDSRYQQYRTLTWTYDEGKYPVSLWHLPCHQPSSPDDINSTMSPGLQGEGQSGWGQHNHAHSIYIHTSIRYTEVCSMVGIVYCTHTHTCTTVL